MEVDETMTEITVPALGESVTEATVGQWFKKPGEAVNDDELLVELETDKVTVEVPAPVGGVLADIKVPQGTTVAVGARARRHRGHRRRQPAAAPSRRPPSAQPRPRPPSASCGRRHGCRRRAGRARATPTRGDGDMPPAPAARKMHGRSRPRRGRRRRHRPPRPDPEGRRAARPPVAAAPAAPAAAPPPPAALRSRRVPGAGPAAPRALGAERCGARGAGEDDAAAPDHRPPPEGRPEHRRHADDVQRGGHERDHGAAQRIQGRCSRSGTASSWASCASSSRPASRP